MRKNYLLLLMIMLFISPLWSQSILVSGKVTSEADGSPIPGVTVQIKGTQKGTITDLNGIYKLDAAPDATLVFTFIGLKKKEIR